MIRLLMGAVPDILMGNEEPWGIEYEAALRSSIPPPHRYRHKDIREGLHEETHGKCAYCESFIEHIAYSQIEHIEPKSQAPRLTCTWTNLTLACPICNTNKGDYFSADVPLLNPYIDNVEDEICFYGPMALDRTDRAKLTISRLRLNRSELLYERYEGLKTISRILDLMQRATGNAALVEALKEELTAALEDSAQYASCSRYFSRAELERRNLN